MKRIAAWVGLFLLVTACATSGVFPETPTEKYVAADGAYKALVATVKEKVLDGTIKGQNAKKVKLALTSAKVALDAWGLAPSDRNAETTALLALKAARQVLQAIQSGQGVILVIKPARTLS